MLTIDEFFSELEKNANGSKKLLLIIVDYKVKFKKNIANPTEMTKLLSELENKYKRASRTLDKQAVAALLFILMLGALMFIGLASLTILLGAGISAGIALVGLPVSMVVLGFSVSTFPFALGASLIASGMMTGLAIHACFDKNDVGFFKSSFRKSLFDDKDIIDNNIGSSPEGTDSDSDDSKPVDIMKK